jgi:CheY-like chemotaxis protein
MPRTLLLADANATIHRIVALTFAGEDIKVVSVSDGEQAIARITAEQPDIVLADIAMSKRNGYDVAAFVKGQPALAHIPVLLLAGALEPVDEARAAQVGCDGVLVKPFEPQHMIARVRELLSGPKGQPAPGSAVSAPQGALPGNAVAPQAPPAPAPPAPAPLAPAPPAPALPTPAASVSPTPVSPMPTSPMPASPMPIVERRDEPSLKLVRPQAPQSASPPVRAAAPLPVKPTPLPTKAAPSAAATPAPPSTEIDDDPLADYFDQLDAAFDSLEVTSPSRSRPLLSDDETETMVVPTFNNVLGDLSREERPSNAPQEILFGAAPVDPPDIRPVPNPSWEPRVRASAPAEPPQTHEPPPAQTPPPPPPSPPPPPPPPPAPPAPEPPLTSEPAPAPAVIQTRALEPIRHPPIAAVDGRRSAIADAFEALLAVEEEQRMASQPRPDTQPVVITDELIEAVADRVMARLAPDGFTDLISRIVTDVAERLVREEIDRIRGRK